MSKRQTPRRLTASAHLTGDAGTPATTVEEIAASAAASAIAATAVTPEPTIEPTPAPVAQTPAPVAVAAAQAPVIAARTSPRLTTAQAASMVAQANRGEIPMGQLQAALTDITYTANADVYPDTWLGHVFEGINYQRRFVPAVAAGAPVTSLKVTGWRWNVAPTVDDYDGDKEAVASNAATTEAIEVPVKRLAGAHDIDRAFFDLGSSDYVMGYWAAMAESYARLSDQYCYTELEGQATDTGTNATPLGTIVQAAMSVMPIGTPSFIGISTEVYAAMAAVNTQEALAFLGGSLSFDGTGSFGNTSLFVSDFVAANTVIAGTRAAASFHELSPALRVNVANVANGGIDAGLFGYCATVVNQPAGLAVATLDLP
jgi:hypothetical protein